MLQPQLTVNIIQSQQIANISAAAGVIGYVGYGTRVPSTANPLQYLTPIVINNPIQLREYLLEDGAGEAFNSLSEIFRVSGSKPVYCMIYNPAPISDLINTKNTWESFTGMGGTDLTEEYSYTKLIDFARDNTSVGTIDLLAIDLYEQQLPVTTDGTTYPLPIDSSIAEGSTEKGSDGLRGGLDSAALALIGSVNLKYEALQIPYQNIISAYLVEFTQFLTSGTTPTNSLPNYHDDSDIGRTTGMSTSRYFTLFASSTSQEIRKPVSLGAFVGFVSTKPIASSLASTGDGAPIASSQTPVFLTTNTAGTLLQTSDDFEPDGRNAADLFQYYDTLSSTGLVFYRRIDGLAGWYVNQDGTLAQPDRLEGRLSNSRVLNVAIIATSAYAKQLLDTNIATREDGTIDRAQAAALEGNFETQLQPLITQLQIQRVRVLIDKQQNILESGKVIASIFIQPFAKAREIEINIGLTRQLQ